MTIVEAVDLFKQSSYYDGQIVEKYYCYKGGYVLLLQEEPCTDGDFIVGGCYEFIVWRDGKVSPASPLYSDYPGCRMRLKYNKKPRLLR